MGTRLALEQHTAQAPCRFSSLPFVGTRTDLISFIQGEWSATGLESGSKFDQIDLTEGDWFDYDEKAGEEVSIKDLKWDIVRA